MISNFWLFLFSFFSPRSRKLDSKRTNTKLQRIVSRSTLIRHLQDRIRFGRQIYFRFLRTCSSPKSALLRKNAKTKFDFKFKIKYENRKLKRPVFRLFWVFSLFFRAHLQTVRRARLSKDMQKSSTAKRKSVLESPEQLKHTSTTVKKKTSPSCPMKRFVQILECSNMKHETRKAHMAFIRWFAWAFFPSFTRGWPQRGVLVIQKNSWTICDASLATSTKTTMENE